MDSPVFFDASGRRRRWVARGLALLVALIVATAAVFATTVVEVPVPGPLKLRGERLQPLPFRAQVAGLIHKARRTVLPGRKPGQSYALTGLPQRVAFYLPDEPDSARSLAHNIGEIDWLVPATGSVSGPGHVVAVYPDRALPRILAGSVHRPRVTMMVQNSVGGNFDTASATSLLADPAAQARVLGQLADAVTARNYQGVTFDFENLPAVALPAYARFLSSANALFDKRGLEVSATVPAGNPDWNLVRFARAVDHLFLMDYDEHWGGGSPGPIASQAWFEDQLDAALATVPPAKLIVALGAYGYDWHGKSADALTVEEAWSAAHDSDALPTYDAASGNAGYAYEEDGQTHTIWFQDAAAAANQLHALGNRAGGVALWRLGSEDPGYWAVQRAWYDAIRGGGYRAPDISALTSNSLANVEGTGEILTITAQPTGGSRTLGWGADGRVTGETYRALPTPYIVHRSGAQARQVALTFDDGPDADWTPKILDILKRENAPATFFVIGENAMAHPGLLRRMVSEGHEIGNHSFTHPNLAEVSPLGTRLELNTTQRLIEAYTGSSTRMFRAPYFGDAEPTTADELGPAWIAQSLGYIIVGLHVDSEDWQRPGVDRIVANTLAGVQGASTDRSGNIVLLHDGGGDRAQTLTALPRIIEGLRAAGYTIVPVSQLVGKTSAQVMPQLGTADLAAVRADMGVFVLLAGLSYALKWLFFFAIGLGIGRIVLLTVLAVLNRGRQAPPQQPSGKVSIIIPAFNEAAVIRASVERILQSDYPDIELLVVDDGSSDGTSDLVRDAFSSDPRVRLLTLVNGGKANALNRALAITEGEIVIALDADTQFLPDTVRRLASWFANPLVGAVAGNARVGNQVNLATRWQAVEYVTAQNVERRALDALGAITVVPGAVGAWRRKALEEVGGYPTDTLAEDQDLTIAIQRKGWRIAYDVEAIALTEAPETFKGLSKQRFRWSFGTLQCLWKHRAVIRSGRPRGLAWVGLPQAWLFQIVFAAVSPIIDLALVVSTIDTAVRVQQHGIAQTQSDLLRMATYWVAFVTIDLVAGFVAYWLDGNARGFRPLRMLGQRFFYRQLMYGVVLRSIGAALQGKVVGWGKLERSGRVSIAAS